MRWQRKPAILAAAVLLQIASLFTFVFTPGNASAAVSSVDWVNVATLKDNEGNIYKEDDLDNDWHFYQQDAKDGCADEVDDIKWNTKDDPLPDDNTADIHIKQKENGDCKEVKKIQDAPLSLKNNAAISFLWKGPGAIEVPEFSKSSARVRFISELIGDTVKGEYHVTTKDQEYWFVRGNDDACPDVIFATSSESGGSATGNLVVAIKKGFGGTASHSNADGDLRDVYNGFSFREDIAFQEEAKVNGNTCLISNRVFVRLGDLAEGKRPAGTDPNKAPPGTTTTGGSTTPDRTGGSGADSDGCDGGSGFGLRWILCPILKAIGDAANSVFEKFVVPLLEVKPLEQGGNLYEVWKNFRDLTNVLLVLVFLFIIFGNAFGVGVDAYTFKKALPKLVIAVIGIQISYFAVSILVDIGNVLGNGIGSLAEPLGLTSAGSSTPAQNIFATVIGVSLAGGAVALASLLSLWPLLLPLALGVIISLLSLIFTLLVRKIIIDVLIVTAPIAILAWVLPNTEKFFKMWWSNLLKIVMMFPLAVLIMAMAGIVSDISKAAAVDGSTTDILGMLAPMIALMMLPTTFKMSGSIMSGIAGTIRNRAASYSKQARTGKMAQGLKEGVREKNALKLGQGNRLQRGLARVGSGNAFSFGAVGRRKIATSQAAAELQQRKDYDDIFKRETPTNADLGAALAEGKLNGKKMNAQMYQAGLERLMRNGAGPEYSKLMKGGEWKRKDGTKFTTGGLQGADGVVDTSRVASVIGGGVDASRAQQLWSNAHEGANGAWAVGKGYNPKGYAKFNDEKGQSVAKYEGERAREFVQQMATSNPTKLLQTLSEITEDSTARTSVSDGFIDELVQKRGALAGQSFTVNGKTFADLDDFIAQGHLRIDPATGKGVGLGAVTP
jgi:hypothetical protein